MRVVRWFVVLLALSMFVFLFCSSLDGGDRASGDDDTADDDSESCADQSNLGTDEGYTMEDFTLYDENGDPLNLYDLCYKVVLIVSSVGWCPACAQEASNIVQDIWEPYKDEDFAIFYTIFEDSSGGVPDEAYLKSFKNLYDLPFHVYGDPQCVLCQYQDTYPRVYTPFNIVLSKEMEIYAEIAGYFVGTIKYYIETLLED